MIYKSPRFERKTKKSVLVELPKGKRFIADPDKKEKISAQRGRTCWYYTLRFLTPEISKNAKHHPDLLELEKALTQLRENLAEIHQRERANRYLNDRIEYGEDGQTYICQLIYTKKYFRQLTDEEQKLLAAYKQKTSNTPFSDFVRDYYKQQEMEAKKNCLSALGIDLSSEIDSLHSIRERAYAIKSSDKSESSLEYDLLITQIIIEKFKLKYASWQPNQGFDKLITAIKEKGALRIAGYFGSFYYKEQAKLSKSKIGSKSILYWPKGKYEGKKENYTSHAVIIVGAEKKGKQEMVYFIDPNDSSDCYDKVYCMSYKLLCENALSLDCIFVDKPIVYDRPYALAANHKFEFECEVEYIIEREHQATRELDLILKDLKAKVIDLKKRGYPEESEALNGFIDNIYKKQKDLHRSLLLSNKDQHQKICDDYKRETNQSFQEMAETLSDHRGYNHLLVETFLSVITIGIYFLAMCNNKFKNGHYTFFKTDSYKKLTLAKEKTEQYDYLSLINQEA